MQITANRAVATAGTNGSVAAASANAADISSTAFMQLLIAQLKNQDPTKPVDSTQYMTQLATLTGVEQSTKQTAALNNMLSAMSLTQAEQVIGKAVTNIDGTISGTAVSARIANDGVYARIEDGREFLLQTGVTIGNP